MDFLFVLLSDRDFSEAKLLNLADAAALRYYRGAFDIQCLTVFQLQFKGLFDLCSLTQIFEIEAYRCLNLRIGFDVA